MQEAPNRDSGPQEAEQKPLSWEMAEYLNVLKDFVLNNAAVVSSALYLYVNLVGIFYAASLYGSFGINFFDYAEIGDFLLAAFKNPKSIIIAGSAIASGFSTLFIAWVLVRSNYTFLGLHASRGIARMSWFIIVVDIVLAVAVIPLSVLIPYALGKVAADSIRTGEGPKVEVQYRSFKGSAGQVTVPGLEPIGTTQKAAFFYDADDKRTLVIPQAQLISIEVPERD